MKTLYLFRSNLKSLEYYHSITDVDDFERNCHDFYLLMPFYFLKMGIFDKVYIYRLSDKKRNTIKFKVKNRKGTKGIFYQVFSTDNFKDVFQNPDKPDVSIFRGGFKEYDTLINMNRKFFGKSFYLGASRRFHPNYGGEYDYILYESEHDLFMNQKNNFKYKRFFKTANPKIFYPKELKKEFDIIWPWKYTSDFRKGEKFFLNAVKNNNGLKQLRIYHCGNEPEKAKKLFRQYGINNIVCDSNKHYHDMADVLNMGFCGLVTSDKEDGCPRLSTEIMACATPLVIRDKTRILNYYRGGGMLRYYDEHSMYNQIIYAIKKYDSIRNSLKERLLHDLSIETICEMNLKEWGII